MEFYIDDSAKDGYSPYNILLVDTNELNTIADAIQKEKGELPLFDYTQDYDADDWYNFFLECNADGVSGMYFTYGAGDEYADAIELNEEDKRKAFEAVLEFFGGLNGYKNYINEYEGEVVYG